MIMQALRGMRGHDSLLLLHRICLRSCMLMLFHFACVSPHIAGQTRGALQIPHMASSVCCCLPSLPLVGREGWRVVGPSTAACALHHACEILESHQADYCTIYISLPPRSRRGGASWHVS